MTQVMNEAAKATGNGSGVSRVAVIGFGTMGSGIAHVVALAGLPVSVVETSQEAIERDMAQIEKFLKRGVDKGRLTEQQATDALGLISPATELSHAFDADLVIE